MVVLALTTISEELLKEMNSQLKPEASHYVGRFAGVYVFMQPVWPFERRRQVRKDRTSNIYLIFAYY